MRSFTVLLVTLLIAMSSLWVSTGEVNWSADGSDAISAAPLMVNAHLTNPAKKEIVYSDVAVPLSSLILAINEVLQDLRFSFYLPLYSLYRVKNYFLLI